MPKGFQLSFEVDGGGFCPHGGRYSPVYVAMSKDYWAMNQWGRWLYGITSMAEKYYRITLDMQLKGHFIESVVSGSDVHRIVSKTALLVSTDIYCDICTKSNITFTDRNAFRRVITGKKYICQDCENTESAGGNLGQSHIKK